MIEPKAPSDNGSTASIDLDSPWKTLIHHLFREFMEFLVPEAAADIDWIRPPEFLDTELRQLIRDATLGRRHADVLARVWLRTGEQVDVLVHIEVQASRESDFSRRLWVYNYRIYDRYGRDVVTIAILADDEASWRPKPHRAGLWQCTTTFEFAAIKLLDFAPRLDELERSDSPVAWAVAAHLRARAARKLPPDQRLDVKRHLARMLYEHGWSEERVIELFRFLDWLLQLPKPHAIRYHQDLRAMDKEKAMPYISTLERWAMEKGEKKGKKEGKKEGKRLGEAHAKRDATVAVLDARAPDTSASLRPLLDAVDDPALLDAVFRAALAGAPAHELAARLASSISPPAHTAARAEGDEPPRA